MKTYRVISHNETLLGEFSTSHLTTVQKGLV